jgi:hypothetical protein
MAESIVSPGPGVYRVDTELGEQGNTRHVVAGCEPVARFDDPEHALFLVALLQEGGAHG